MNDTRPREGRKNHPSPIARSPAILIPYPSMATFDAPSRELCTLRRPRTNTPLQALVTLNDPVYVEAAQSLGSSRLNTFFKITVPMMIPGIIFLIPHYLMMIDFGWVDTYHALIWPGLPAAFGVFLMRQFILGLPRDLVEAARIDGAGELAIFGRVILPLLTPALATLGILTFLGSWNNFLWPLVVARSSDMWTVPVGLNSLRAFDVVAPHELRHGRFAHVAMLDAALAFIAPQIAEHTVTGHKHRQFGNLSSTGKVTGNRFTEQFAPRRPGLVHGQRSR